MKQYIGNKEAWKLLRVHYITGEEMETIRTPGGKRLYNIKIYIRQ